MSAWELIVARTAILVLKGSLQIPKEVFYARIAQ